jgi:hypothetical protein
MNTLDKKAFKFGLIAAVVAAVLPLLIQTVLTATPLASNIA